MSVVRGALLENNAPRPPTFYRGEQHEQTELLLKAKRFLFVGITDAATDVDHDYYL